MRPIPDELIRAAMPCGIYLTIDGNITFHGRPADALYEFYKSIQSQERRDLLEILGNVIERERCLRST